MDRNFDVSTVYVVSVGQARKSLWIETLQIELPELKKKGQARKSLWIETFRNLPVSERTFRSGS